jgi:hypothetical protein
MPKIKDLEPDKKQEDKMDKDYRRQFESIQQLPLPLFKVGTDGSHQLLTLKGRVILFLNEETFPKILKLCVPDNYKQF